MRSARSIAAGVVVACALAGCSGGNMEASHALALGGDPVRGERELRSVGCAACHLVPGVRAPRGEVGPALTAFTQRTYIAGVLPNTPENLTRWLMDPQAIEPQTAMPKLGLSETDARDIATFLYTLD